MAEQEGMTARKDGDFSEWYNQAVLKAELADFSGVKGFMFIRPYGYALWEAVQAALDGMLKATGHRNAYAPALIPEPLLRKEKDHVEGFSPELFIVTQAGSSPLEEKLVLRPTSETVIYDAYAAWVRSWRDLPLRLNYWNSVFRAEIKMTKLFLRTCEFLWQEGHTVHATREEAETEVSLILGLYKRLIEDHLAIPVLAGRKSEKEKFAGAAATWTLEALMPDGKALQMGTSHHLGQNFSRAFGITFLDEKQRRQHAWQTSWGVSTRLIGAVIMVHGDDRGLVLPPRIAPVQLVIVPIFQEKTRDAVLREAMKLGERLRGFRTEVDAREGYSPGWKFNEWELRGVPLRLELGPRDLEKQQATLVRRDTGTKQPIPLKGLEAAIAAILEDIQSSLLAKARAFLDSSIRTVATLQEFAATLEKRRGFLLAGWCQSRACEERVKEQTAADIRLIPDQAKPAPCIACGKKGIRVYFAKAY